MAPEEVFLAILVHFFVQPPPAEYLPGVDLRTVPRQLAVFLLQELKACRAGHDSCWVAAKPGHPKLA
jgi:hypothetical protein